MENKHVMCQNCGKNEAKKLHPCPFKIDCYNDDKTLCNCCDNCVSVCANDI